MRILIAPNAFKGTLTAKQAAAAIARGLRRAVPRATLIELPIADGGDGFADVLAAHFHARWIRRRVHGPLGEKITASFALSKDGSTAIIELARASGLALVTRAPRPLDASTFGTGQLLRAALDQGAQKILLGIGGSATTDAGTGLARALGIRFLDKHGRELPPGGAPLIHLAHIDLTKTHPRLRRTPNAKRRTPVTIQVACDVTNPLHGRRGAAHIFSPQKGATLAQVRQLDAALRHFAAVARRDLAIDVQSIPGAGAAGGTGAGLAALLGAQLMPGFDLVADALKLRKAILAADLIITGEGRLDAQSAEGKAPGGMLQLAGQFKKPAVAIVGTRDRSPGAVLPPFAQIFSVDETPGVRAATTAARGLERCAQLAAGAMAREVCLVP